MEPQPYDQGPPALGPPQTEAPAPVPSPKAPTPKPKRATRASKRKATEPLEELRENDGAGAVSDIPPVLPLEGELPCLSLEQHPPIMQQSGIAFNETGSFGLGNVDNSFFPEVTPNGSALSEGNLTLTNASLQGSLPPVNLNMSLMENMGYDGTADPQLQQQSHAIEGTNQ